MPALHWRRLLIPSRWLARTCPASTCCHEYRDTWELDPCHASTIFNITTRYLEPAIVLQDKQQ